MLADRRHALPGRKGPRLVLLGACIALGAAVLYFANDIAGDEVAARCRQDAAVVDALWDRPRRRSACGSEEPSWRASWWSPSGS